MTANLPMPRVEYDAEDPDHFLFFHRCSELHRKFDDAGGKLPLGPNGWQRHADGSITPSIRCLECETHGFWDGPKGWRPV